MPSYTLEIEAFGVFATNMPSLEIWEDGVLDSTHSISSNGSTFLVTINYGGSLPTSLALTFNDGFAANGRTIEIRSVKINNQYVNTSNYLSSDSLTKGQSATVDIDSINTDDSDFIFDSSDPAGAEFTTGATETFTAGNDTYRRYDDSDDEIFDMLDGRDVAYLGSGDDKVSGGAGDDTIRGGAGTDLLYGGADNDRIYGGDDNDTIYGGTGNDRLHGEDGDDEIHGGDGNDTLNGHAGDDVLTGGAGEDKLNGGAGVDYLFGGADNDQLVGGAGADTLDGGDGNDIIYGGADNDHINGGAGADVIVGGLGVDTINGDAGDDTIYLMLNDWSVGEIIYGGTGTDELILSKPMTIDFTTGVIDGLETLTGSDGDQDVTYTIQQALQFTTIDLAGGTDNSRVQISGAVDVTALSAPTVTNVENGFVLGSAGADDLTISGEQLDALVYGTGTIDFGANADILRITSTSVNLNALASTSNASVIGLEEISANAAASGVDVDVSAQTESFIITGSGFDDNITGGGDSDTIYGGAGVDNINGGNSNDLLYGGDGNDVILGGVGADTIYGGDGDDVIDGEGSPDTIYGGDGNDTISGGSSSDYIEGGDGDDYIDGGTSNDTLYGGNDNDTLIGFSNDDTLYGGDGDDFLDGGRHDDLLEGGAGSDELYGGDENDTIYAGDSSTLDFTSISGKVLWLDAADSSTIIDDDGDNAGTGAGGANDGFDGDARVWVDKSGSGNDLSAAAGRAPIYNLDAQNGLNSLTFDGANDELTGTASVSGSEVTVFAVYEKTATGSGRSDVIDIGTNSPLRTTLGVKANDTPTAITVNNGSADFNDYSGSYNQNQYYVNTLFHDGTQFTGFIDGVQRMSMATFNRQSSTAIHVGNDSTGGDHFSGNISEIIVYDRILTTSEREMVEDHLMQKWQGASTGSTDLNVLDGGDGLDTLYGSDGSETFMFNATSAFNDIDVITNYHKHEGDVIDVSDILSAHSITSANIDLFVQVTSNEGVRVDMTGSGNFGAATQIASFSGSTVINDASTMLDDGNIIA